MIYLTIEVFLECFISCSFFYWYTAYKLLNARCRCISSCRNFCFWAGCTLYGVHFMAKLSRYNKKPIVVQFQVYCYLAAAVAGNIYVWICNVSSLVPCMMRSQIVLVSYLFFYYWTSFECIFFSFDFYVRKKKKKIKTKNSDGCSTLWSKWKRT